MADAQKSPDPTDVHVGGKVKLRRTTIGMSQEKLANQLGITFQQVQKYEKGTNRIGGSRLWMIAQVLGVSIDYFFEDIEGGVKHNSVQPEISSGDKEIYAFLATREGAALNEMFSKIKNPTIRRRITEMTRTLAIELYGNPGN